MNLKTLKDIDVKNKTVLYRAPYDIGTSKNENGDYVIKDDSRITATLDTLKYLLDNSAKIVILTWVGRPDGKVVEELRTTPHAKVLSNLLQKPVKKIDECVGEIVDMAVSEMQFGDILMLENSRFHPGEDKADENFARQLTKNVDVIVFDGFPQSHRVHASTTQILKFKPAVAGFYFEKEVLALSSILENPKRPLTIIIGGAKISDKVDAINNLYNVADKFLIGGGTANVFLKAAGIDIGGSFVEDVFVDETKKIKKDWAEYASEIMNKPDASNKIVIPIDSIVTNQNKEQSSSYNLSYAQENQIPASYMALDIGLDTQKLYEEIISSSGTVFWNGPMGMFEQPGFEKGTQIVAKAMENSSGTTIIGGGDTIDAAKKYCDVNKISMLSLAGGATLEFLSGKKLPVLELLKK